MAQTNPASSRAIAVVTVVVGFPAQLALWVPAARAAPALSTAFAFSLRHNASQIAFEISVLLIERQRIAIQR
jgi:hypothetical protein